MLGGKERHLKIRFSDWGCDLRNYKTVQRM